MIFLRVTPQADQDGVAGIDRRDPAQDRLSIRVRAAPDKGAANKAVIAILAKALGVPKSACVLTAGQTSRRKTIRITGDPAMLRSRLSPFMEVSS